jgi:hypothetical protein
VNHGYALFTRVGRFVEDERELARLLQGFVVLAAAGNSATMRALKARGMPLPPIYTLPLVWYAEPPGPVQPLHDVVTVIEQGWGACGDLVAIRMAELDLDGHKSSPIISWRDPRTLPVGEGPRLHARLRHEQFCTCRLCKHQPRAVLERGLIEEPSRLLGM